MPSSTQNQISILTKFAAFFHLQRFNWLGFIIWGLGAILLAVLLVLNFLPLITEYTSNNVDTRIAVIRSGSGRPPNVSVCLPYPSRSLANVAKWLSITIGNQSENGTFGICHECEALRIHSWDLWRKMNQSVFEEERPEILEYTLASAFLGEVLDAENFDVMILNRTNFNWNQPIVDSFQRLLECIISAEYRYIGSNVSYVPDPHACTAFNSEIMPRLTKENINYLHKYFVRAIEVYLKFEVYFQLNEPPAPDRLGNRSHVSIGVDEICFPLLNNTAKEVFTYSSLDPSIDPTWVRYKRQVPMSIWPDESTLYGTTFYIDTIYGTDLSNVDRINREIVNIAFDINMKIVETRDQAVCTKGDTPPVLCMIKRQLNEITHRCGCIPFSWQDLHQTDLPLCNDSFYAKCSDHLVQAIPDYEQQCNDKCEDIFYKWKSIAVAVHQDSPNMTFAIGFPPHHVSPYVEFSVTLKDTPEQFLSQIGGLINFYLGFSGLSLVGFAIFCVELMKESWRNEGRKRGRVNQQWRSPVGKSSGEGARTVDVIECDQQPETGFGEDNAVGIPELRDLVRSLIASNEDMIGRVKNLEVLLTGEKQTSRLKTIPK